MARSAPALRVRHVLARALIPALGLMAACVDGSLTGPTEAGEVVVQLAPYFVGNGPAALVDAPISAARLTARDAATGTTYGVATVDLDPDAELWSLPLTLELPTDPDVRVVVTIELLSVVNGIEIVQWSGVTAPLALLPGTEPNEIHQVPIYRGPPDNLGVASVELAGAPAAVIEGESFPLSAVVSGGGAQTAVFFATLDEAVATVSAEGVVTTRARGTARIVAVAGPKADTVQVEVRPYPLPDRAVIAVIEPGLDDTVDRVVPHLTGDAPTATALGGLVASIRTELARGFGLRARQALDEARARLASYGGGGPAATADGPELALVGLVLDHVERILQAAR